MIYMHMLLHSISHMNGSYIFIIVVPLDHKPKRYVYSLKNISLISINYDNDEEEIIHIT